MEFINSIKTGLTMSKKKSLNKIHDIKSKIHMYTPEESLHAIYKC
jgi:hypothetical protein